MTAPELLGLELDAVLGAVELDSVWLLAARVLELVELADELEATADELEASADERDDSDAEELGVDLAPLVTATVSVWLAWAVPAISAINAPAPITEPAATPRLTRRRRRSAASRWA